MDLEGWHPDPFGIHEERLFRHGEPTPVVRDDGVGSMDALLVTGPIAGSDTKGADHGPAENGPPGMTRAGGVARPLTPSYEDSVLDQLLDHRKAEAAAGQVGPVGSLWNAGVNMSQNMSIESPSPQVRAAKRPTNRWLALAVVLMAVGLLMGLLSIAGVGGRSQSAHTPTTSSPPVRKPLQLPPQTTVSPFERANQALPPPTTLSPFERALQAIPLATMPAATMPAATTPAVVSSRSTNVPSGNSATRVTQATRPPLAPKPTQPVVLATTIPPTTTTTSVGLADRAWYLAYGSVFNTLQTDIEKLDRALGATSQSLYSTVDPYWKGLLNDARNAMTIPPLPDSASQSFWASSLGDLSEGAVESIVGSLGGIGFGSSTFQQGAALITTGTTQLYDAAGSVQSVAAATSAGARVQVRQWNATHGTLFNTLQSDINKLSGAFSSTSAPNYSTVDPYWQQLLNDAQSALAMAPIPDSLSQSYWSTSLNDLIQGSSDCIDSSEAPPPNVFDEGVALIQSGTTYLSISAAAVHSLSG